MKHLMGFDKYEVEDIKLIMDILQEVIDKYDFEMVDFFDGTDGHYYRFFNPSTVRGRLMYIRFCFAKNEVKPMLEFNKDLEKILIRIKSIGHDASIYIKTPVKHGPSAFTDIIINKLP